MTKFCTACGAVLVEGRGFCGACGAAVIAPPVVGMSATAPVTAPATGPDSAPIAEARFIPTSPPAAPVYTPPEPVYYPDELTVPMNRNRWLIGGGLALIAVLAGLYFFLFRYHNMADQGGTPTAIATPKPVMADTQLYTVTQANIRDKATATGSNVVGKIPRGTPVTGKLALGEDGVSDWLELSDSTGFVGAVNLSETAPPVLTKIIADKIWAADKSLEIWAQPDSTSSLIDRVAAGKERSKVQARDSPSKCPISLKNIFTCAAGFARTSFLFI